MAAIDNTTSPRRTKGVKKLSGKSTLVDLTPMVDLGFLLITFFVLTTSMARPKVLPLVEPNDSDPGINTSVCQSCALTLIPANDRQIYYYEGMLQQASDIKITSFSTAGLRSLILQKKQSLAAQQDSTKQLILIVKPGDESNLQDFTDIADEVLINGVKRYFVAEPDDKDRQLLPGIWKY